MNKQTIAFVTPPSPFLLDERVFISLGVLKVAAVVEGLGYEVEHLDLNGVGGEGACLSVLGAFLQGSSARTICLTATTPQMPAVEWLVRALRECGVDYRIVLGGPHPTLTMAAVRSEFRRRVYDGRARREMNRLMDLVDVIVSGDGESVIASALGSRGRFLIDVDQAANPLFMNAVTLNELPLPARHLVDVRSYKYDLDGVATTSLIGQLGCPMSCAFCAGRSSPMLRRMRLRSTESVIAELEHLHTHYGFSGFMFLDDELNINRQFIELLTAMGRLQDRLGVAFKCRGFVKAELFTEEQAIEMRRNGFRRILCGFESGNERILKNIRKNATKDDNSRVVELCAKYGIEVKALMSIGHAGESEETVRDTVDWLKENRPADFDVTIITPYPGSPYYDDAVRTSWSDRVWAYRSANGDRLFMDEVDYAKTADYYKGVPGEYVSHVWTDHLTADELVKLRDSAEADVRAALKIPYNTKSVNSFEASMGQSKVANP